MGIDAATVAQHWKTYFMEGQIEYIPKFTEIISIIDKEHQWAIKEWILRDPQLALADIRVMIEVAFQIEVSITTVYWAIKKMKFSWQKLGTSPYNCNNKAKLQRREDYAKAFVIIKWQGQQPNFLH